MIALLSGGVSALLIQFIVLLIVLAIVAGLIWAIESWVHPVPAQAKLVLALILVLLVVLWAISAFTGQGFTGFK